MTDNSEHLEINAAAGKEQERFSDAYKRAMDGVTMSPQLRERVLRLQNKKPEPLILRVARPIACAAACLAVVIAARSWLKTENFTFDTADTTEAAARSFSSEAIVSSTHADYAPETAAESYGAADEAASAAPAEDSKNEAAPEEQQAAANDANDTNDTGDGAAEAAVPTEGGAQSSGYAASSEPYVLGAHTDMPENEPEGGVLPEEETDGEPESKESKDVLNELSENGGGLMGIANPLVSYDSVQEAETVLGWTVKLPPLPEIFSVTLISGSLFEVDWDNGNSYYRMAKAELGSDISGDYNSYPITTTVENGYALQLRGDAQDAYRLLTWQDGGYSYAYYSDAPMTADEARSLVEQILGE